MSDLLIWLLSVGAIALGMVAVVVGYALAAVADLDARLTVLETHDELERAEGRRLDAERRQHAQDLAHLAGHPPRVAR